MINMYNILLMIACYFTSNFIYSPALSAVSDDFGISSELTKATMTMFQTGALLSCFIAAFFADFIGKKNYLVLGLTLATFGSVICIFAPDIYTLMIGRFLQGFGAAVGFMMGFALAVDLFKPEDTLKIIAINGISVAVISIFSPYLGGYLAAAFSWHYCFVFITPFYLLSLFASYRYLPQEANNRTPQLNLIRSLKESRTILSSRTYLSYSSLNGLFLFNSIFILSFAPFYYKTHFQLSSDEIGMLIGLTIFFSFGLSSTASIWLNRRYHPDNMIFAGLSIGLFASILLMISSFIFPELLSINILAVSISSFGAGVLYAASISQSMRVFPELTTKASAIRTVILTAGSFMGALVAQNVSEEYPSNLALTLLALSIIGITMFNIREKTKTI